MFLPPGPLLEELAPEVLFSTQINVIYAQHLININGDVYRHMNDHRDAYRLFVVFISTSSFKVFDVVSPTIITNYTQEYG